MNVTDTAKKWHISTTSVRKYCREGFIDGAEKSKLSGAWEIPDNATQPFFFSPSKAKDQFGRLILILRSIDKRKVIPFSKLNADYDLTIEYLNLLVSRKLIYKGKKISSDKPLFLQYLLTERGEQFVRDNKSYEKMKKLLPSIMALTVESTVTGILNSKFCIYA